jgi:hypothetical protein
MYAGGGLAAANILASAPLLTVLYSEKATKYIFT